MPQGGGTKAQRQGALLFGVSARRTGALLLLAAAGLLSQPAAAQTDTQGAIAGTVLDRSGAVVQGADVVVRDAEDGVSTETFTDAAGLYRFPALRPGGYTLTITQSTFAQFRVDRVSVELGRVTELPARLAPASRGETVLVREDTPRLDLESPAVSSNIDGEEVHDLPTDRRRATDFVLLTPAVTSGQAGFGLLNFRGISALQNNYTVDGIDNNQAFFGEQRGRNRIAYLTSQASVREFQVNTSNSSVEAGRAAGGIVNTVTRSGTNQLRGELFFYDRDSLFGSARNPYTQLVQEGPADPTTGNPPFSALSIAPRDWRKQWGLAVGGPLVRNKLFWFITYDQFRRNFPGVARVGNIDGFFNEPLTSAELTTLALRLELPLNIYAKQQYYQVLSGLAGETGVVPRAASQLILFPRLDWQPSERHRFSLQGDRLRWSSPDGARTQTSEIYGVASFGDHQVKTDSGIARWSFFLRPGLMNELRYGYSRDFESEFSEPPTPFEAPLSQNVYGRPPEVSLLGRSTGIRIGKPATLDRAAFPDERRQQLADTVTWVHGNHFFAAGYDFNHVNDQIDSIPNGNGTYVYDSLPSFVADYLNPGHCGETSGTFGFLPCYSYFRQTLGPSQFDFDTNDYAAFAADEWKVRHGLTLSAGVRYDFEQVPGTNALLANPQLPQTANIPRDTNNFGPRVGLAWDPFGHGHTVLRAAYGLYYGRLLNSTLFTALTNTGSSGGQLSYYFRPTDAGAPDFPHVFAGRAVGAIVPDVSYFQPGFQNPQVHEFELSVAQEFARGTELTLSALQSLGRELPGYLDTNIDLAGASTITYNIVDPDKAGPLAGPQYTTTFFTGRLNPGYGAITEIRSAVNSHYEAGILKVTHRASRGVHLQASYTYAHAWDGHQTESDFVDVRTVLDPSDPQAEYGRSDFDVRQRLTGSLILRSPRLARGLMGLLANGYSLAPTFSLQSGLPFSLETTGAVPSLAIPNQLGTLTRLRGLGDSINGSGGDRRIAAVGRNTFHRPGTVGVNARASKELLLSDRVRLQLAADVTNVLNHQNVTRIDAIGYTIADSSSSRGGTPTLTWNPFFNTTINANSTVFERERQIQLVGRLRF